MGVYSKIKRLFTARTNQADTPSEAAYEVYELGEGTGVYDFRPKVNTINVPIEKILANIGKAGGNRNYGKKRLPQRNVADRKPSKTSKNAKEEL